MRQLRSIIEGWWFMLRGKNNELSKTRSAICSPCQHKDKRLNSCKECGCFLPAKTRVDDAQCPFGYW